MHELDRYRWCGHSVLMGTRKCEFQDTAQVLRRFGKNAAVARKNYREFLDEKSGGTEDNDELTMLVRRSNAEKRNRHEPACWVIGDHEFVKQTIERDCYRRAEIAAHAAQGWNLDRVAGYVAGTMHVPLKELAKRGRGTAGSRARQVLAYLGFVKPGIPQREIGEYLGVSASAISQMANWGEIAAQNAGISKLNF
jgi:hypothetical protein